MASSSSPPLAPPAPAKADEPSRPRLAAAKLSPEERRAAFLKAAREDIERNRRVYESLAKR